MEKKYRFGLVVNIVLTVLCAAIIVLGMVSKNTPDSSIMHEPGVEMTEGPGEEMPEGPEMAKPEGPAFAQPEGTFNAYNIATPLMLLLIIYYTVIGYKKPHGNMLKYLMLIFTVMLLVKLSGSINFERTDSACIYAAAMAIIAYIAGRLHRIEQNRYLTVVVMVGLLYIAVSSFVDSVHAGNVIQGLSEFVTPIMWCDLCAAYFTRYLQHKEAGLMDKGM